MKLKLSDPNQPEFTPSCGCFEWAAEANGQVYIGASFVDAEALRTRKTYFLLNCELKFQ